MLVLPVLIQILASTLVALAAPSDAGKVVLAFLPRSD